MKPLDEALKTFAASRCGPVTDARFAGWDHGESSVWRLTHEDGRETFLKRFSRGRKAAQARVAYQQWLSQLPSGDTPALLGVHAQGKTHALLLEALPGVLVQDAELTLDEAQVVHRQAGQFLTRLHALAFEDDDLLSLDDAIARRFDAWLRRAVDLLDAATCAQTRRRFNAGPGFEGARRVYCHRDFQPRNWLVNRVEGELTTRFIDFEHARPDHWLVDLLKLRDRDWIREPSLREAFFQGYGSPLSERDTARLDQLGLWHALATMVWGAEHGDEDFESHGRRSLARLL